MAPETAPPDPAQEWIARASGNLSIARNTLPGVEWAELCFNAHQAAEKAIKAVLIHQRVDFPYIHSLKPLLALSAASGIDVPQAVAQAVRLTRYAVAARYPLPPEDKPAQRDYDEAIADAAAVLHWAEQILDYSPER
jgi:HEPN domain-containing protein